MKRLAVILLLFAFSLAARADEDAAFRTLSAEDAALYRQIFVLQESGNWIEADKLIKKVSDPLLMGHVKFQRYMHPTKYRSSFAELSGWMGAYADHPGANRVYSLALKRRGSAAYPKAPLSASPAGVDTAKLKPSDPRSAEERKAVASFKGRVSSEIRRNRPERAEKRLWAMEARALLTESEWVDALISVAENYFYNGKDEKALAIASLAVEEAKTPQAGALWIAGLAAWRGGDCERAEANFRPLADGATSDAWLAAAGGVWAARSAIACQRPEAAPALLVKAAGHKTTFYGLIAHRQLGIEPPFRWDALTLDSKARDALLTLPSVRRAAALVEAGRPELADEELRLVWSRRQAAAPEDLIAFAAALDLPATQVIVARGASTPNALPDSPFYPVPNWQPDGGFEIDRALFFAIMRQESHFMPRAKSSVGAMGLMQLMPATASFIMRDRSLRLSGKERLYEPTLNMTIAQTYLRYLFSEATTGGSLIKVTSAYHSGPGNVAKWQARVNHQDDPLLFIESIPGKEARNYLEKVLANYWIYQHRFGQPSPSLDALAAGAWPVYDALDSETERFAETGNPPAIDAQN
ncbi:MAG TPA: lytic transglycosylase domain-containing protein [Sphingomonadales bacterium]|nr:lytic transglycosylase domain-containing protein [Sphingomonadales bacterium]